MPILTTQFNDLVRNATISWREGYGSVPEAARQLYDISSNDLKITDFAQIDSSGFAKRKDEGDAYAVSNPRQGYSLTLTKTRIGIIRSVTWEMRKYDKYREIMRLMNSLGQQTANRIELDLTHMFTFGLQGSSYVNMDGETVNTVTGDGVQLFSDSHTITKDSTNVDNYNGTTSFSRTGLEAAERLFRNMVDNNGVKVTPNPDTIITSDDPAMVNAVSEFLNSTLVPDGSDNAVNTYKAKYKHVILPLLATDNLGAPSATGRYYWMLADSKHKDAICEFSEMPTFVSASPGQNGEDFDTDDWKFKSSASYAYGVLDFKWIVGSAATTV